MERVVPSLLEMAFTWMVSKSRRSMPDWAVISPVRVNAATLAGSRVPHTVNAPFMVTAPEIDAVLSTSRLEDIDTLLEKVQKPVMSWAMLRDAGPPDPQSRDI